jgi:hypothetical protein
MAENPKYFRHFRREPVKMIVRVIYILIHAFGTYMTWLKFHVDVGRVCTTVKNGEGEPLVSFIKLVSGMVRRQQRATR